MLSSHTITLDVYNTGLDLKLVVEAKCSAILKSLGEISLHYLRKILVDINKGKLVHCEKFLYAWLRVNSCNSGFIAAIITMAAQ